MDLKGAGEVGSQAPCFLSPRSPAIGRWWKSQSEPRHRNFPDLRRLVECSPRAGRCCASGGRPHPRLRRVQVNAAAVWDKCSMFDGTECPDCIGTARGMASVRGFVSPMNGEVVQLTSRSIWDLQQAKIRGQKELPWKESIEQHMTEAAREGRLMERPLKMLKRTDRSARGSHIWPCLRGSSSYSGAAGARLTTGAAWSFACFSPLTVPFVRAGRRPLFVITDTVFRRDQASRARVVHSDHGAVMLPHFPTRFGASRSLRSIDDGCGTPWMTLRRRRMNDSNGMARLVADRASCLPCVMVASVKLPNYH
jgi:hypothetical protein